MTASLMNRQEHLYHTPLALIRSRKSVFCLLLLLSIMSSAVLAQTNQPQAKPKETDEMQFFELAETKARLVGEIGALNQSIAEAKRKIPIVQRGEDLMAQRKTELSRLSSELEAAEKAAAATPESSAIQAVEFLKSKKVQLEQELQLIQNELGADTVTTLRKDLATAEAALETKRGLQLDVERKILSMRTPAHEFKTTLSIMFAGLIAAVIIGFFVIAYIDPSVRSAIFGGQSGIQFLTLFSVVIAIILFGITAILDGKELAALLGGLSGFILGRSTQDGPARRQAQREQVSSGSADAVAAPAGLMVTSDAAGMLKLTCDAVANAIEYLWYVKTAGEADFQMRTKTKDPVVQLSGFASGEEAAAQVAVSTAAGTGPRSDIVRATVA